MPKQTTEVPEAAIEAAQNALAAGYAVGTVTGRARFLAERALEAAAPILTAPLREELERLKADLAKAETAVTEQERVLLEDLQAAERRLEEIGAVAKRMREHSERLEREGSQTSHRLNLRFVADELIALATLQDSQVEETVEIMNASNVPASGEEPGSGLAGLKQLVDRQAEDDGLWFIARNASTAYIQQELRRLHAAVELQVELAATLPEQVDGEPASGEESGSGTIRVELSESRWGRIHQACDTWLCDYADVNDGDWPEREEYVDAINALRCALDSPSSLPALTSEAITTIDALFAYLSESGLAEGGLALYEKTKPLAEIRARLAATLPVSGQGQVPDAPVDYTQGDETKARAWRRGYEAALESGAGQGLSDGDRRRLLSVVGRLEQTPGDNAARDAVFLRALAGSSTQAGGDE